MIWSLFLQLLSGPPFPSDPAPRSGLTSSLPPPNPSPPSTGRKKGLTVLRATSSSTLSLQKGLTSSTTVEVVGPYTLGCPAGTISKLDPPPSTSWCTCPWCSGPSPPAADTTSSPPLPSGDPGTSGSPWTLPSEDGVSIELLSPSAIASAPVGSSTCVGLITLVSGVSGLSVSSVSASFLLRPRSLEVLSQTVAPIAQLKASGGFWGFSTLRLGAFQLSVGVNLLGLYSPIHSPPCTLWSSNWSHVITTTSYPNHKPTGAPPNVPFWSFWFPHRSPCRLGRIATKHGKPAPSALAMWATQSFAYQNTQSWRLKCKTQTKT